MLIADPEPAGAMKIEAKGAYPWAEMMGAKNVVIRDAAELVEASQHKFSRATDEARKANATSEVCTALGVKGIDWSKQMLVVVSAGPKPTGGYSVTITDAKMEKGTLKIQYVLKSPGPGDIVTQAFTHPSQVILLPKFAGKVEFVGGK
jgi:hypothetical protein